MISRGTGPPMPPFVAFCVGLVFWPGREKWADSLGGVLITSETPVPKPRYEAVAPVLTSGGCAEESTDMTTPASRTLPTRFMGARLVPRLQLSASGFLLNARDGETFSLNETASCLLQALLRGVPPIDAWRVLVARFAVADLQAQRDAQLFLARLFDVGLLELPRDHAASSARSTPGASPGTSFDPDEEEDAS